MLRAYLKTAAGRMADMTEPGDEAVNEDVTLVFGSLKIVRSNQTWLCDMQRSFVDRIRHTSQGYTHLQSLVECLIIGVLHQIQHAVKQGCVGLRKHCNVDVGRLCLLTASYHKLPNIHHDA